MPELIFLLLIAGGGYWFYKKSKEPSKLELRDQELIRETQRLQREADKAETITPTTYIEVITEQMGDGNLCMIAAELFKQEDFNKPGPAPKILTGVDGGRYRDALIRYINLASDLNNPIEYTKAVIDFLKPFNTDPDQDGLFTGWRELTPDEVSNILQYFLKEERFFWPVKRQFFKNISDADGYFPQEYNGHNVAWAYLKDTPLIRLTDQPVEIEWINRAAHTLVIGGSGSGKTTLYKHMIAKLIEEDCCVIVMDSQSQVIEELAHLKLEEDDLTWISPEHRLALNPFDIDPEDLKDETVINNKISLLEFVVENLIEAPMTPRQKNLFYYCTQLVLAIPDGNVKTYKEVLQDPFNFADTIDTLDETAQDFFFKELRAEGSGRNKSNAYDRTREELSYRLDGLTKQPTFRRIFQAEENTFDFYAEMLERKLILLDTSQALLADDSATLGRFFIANALQACFQRVRNKETKRPVYFFIDEAHEYFDDKLERMLLQARKANVGMILATQDLSRATKAGIADTLIGSTSTKIVSKVGTGDARKLAPTMNTSHEYLTNLGAHTFAFFSGEETFSIQANADPLEYLPKHDSINTLREEMEYHYGPESEEEPANPKPKPEKPPMSENGDQDIEPGDTL